MFEPLLQFEGVTLHAPEGEGVFSEVTWSLEPRGRMRLEPETGIGTTALLRLAAGLAQPTEGRVLLEGQPFTYGASHHPALAAGHVGWVPTTGGLLVNLSLLANLTLPLRAVCGMTRSTAESEAMAWLEQAGLLPLASKRPHAFDPTSRWLGALARCAAMGARLWLVDRPPSTLDEEGTILASALLRQGLGTEGAALVVDGQDGWSGFQKVWAFGRTG